jgi:site-specific recombinase XerD
MAINFAKSVAVDSQTRFSARPHADSVRTSSAQNHWARFDSANLSARADEAAINAAKLPIQTSPHSFRVSTLTDLLESGAELSDVQHFAGHADARTTKLYDRRQEKITRNLVERIYDLKLEN